MTEVEIYVHRAGQRQVDLLVISVDTPIGEAVGADGDDVVWVDDGEEPVDHRSAGATVGVAARSHVHIGRCHRIEVTVHHNTETIERDFPANARIQRVFEWATGKKGFELSPTDRTEHVLQVCGSVVEPDEGDRLESVVSEGCKARFNLVPKHRFEG